MLWLVASLVACSGKGEDTAADGETLGTLTSPEGETGTVSPTSFAFNSPSNGKIAIFYAGNAGATCSDVARALSNDRELDPAAITPSGTCSAFIYADYTAPDPTTWTGSPATLVMNCAFGTGTWAQTADCDAGYCYTGTFWSGAPASFSVTASGGDESDYAWDLTASDGAGGYPYESLDDVALTGVLSGSGTATWCPEIGTGEYF